MPPRYADSGVRQSRARLDYEYGASASQYGDAYGDRYAVVFWIENDSYFLSPFSNRCVAVLTHFTVLCLQAWKI